MTLFETQSVSVPKWLLIVLIVTIITLVAGIYYYNLDANDAKLVGLVGGVISGGLVFLLTYIVSVQPLRDLARYEQMGIRGLLASRHDKAYYTALVSKARRSVQVMGASCTRFVDDFLDPQSEDHALLDALRRHQGLHVQLLIPDDKHISEDAKARLPSLFHKLHALSGEFGKRIELRRFPAKAQHSFVSADDDLVAGPIFQDNESKYAPAVHVAMSTRFAQKYHDHFETVWTDCESAD
ncbi:hypothetical protein [Bradyrhizobium sp.]|uniref:hypothetical protein n=1 Tax=Bradyrhizobium sp. TaxID=376 RepID=UPI0039E2423B